WLYIRSRELEVLDSVPVPVQITLAPGQADRYDVEVTGPSEIPVTFTGPPTCIRELRGLLQRSQVQIPYTLFVPEDREQETRYFDTVRVDATYIHTVPWVTPLVIEGRNRIPVTVRR